MRYGMVINLHKCVGCYSCVIKCKQEHFLPPDMTWGKLMLAETGVHPDVIKHTYPVLCNHCHEPACLESCPTGATQQREDGIVWIDQEKKIMSKGDCFYIFFDSTLKLKNLSKKSSEILIVNY